jgi:flavodoxin
VKQRRALILYASMSGNTEKIAKAFQESFESYNWEVTLFKLAANADWLGMQE